MPHAPAEASAPRSKPVRVKPGTVQRYAAEASARGWIFLEKISHGTALYRCAACGALRDAPAANMRHDQVRCTCRPRTGAKRGRSETERVWALEAIPQGWRYLGRMDTGGALYEHAGLVASGEPCGHTQEIDPGRIRCGRATCARCGDRERDWKEAALSNGFAWLGRGEGRRHRYRHSCGAEIEASPGHMKSGQVRCVCRPRHVSSLHNFIRESLTAFEIPFVEECTLEHSETVRAALGIERCRADFMIDAAGHRKIAVEIDGTQHFGRRNGFEDLGRQVARDVAKEFLCASRGIQIIRFNTLENWGLAVETIASAAFGVQGRDRLAEDMDLSGVRPDADFQSLRSAARFRLAVAGLACTVLGRPVKRGGAGIDPGFRLSA